MKRIRLEPDRRTVKNGRDNKGRFAPGNKAASERRAPSTETVRRALYRLVEDGPGGWDAVFTALVRQAKSGNTRSMKLLLEYTFGRPAQSVQVVNDESPNPDERFL